MDPALAVAPTDPFMPPALRSGSVLGQVCWEQPSFTWTPLANASLPPGRGQPLMLGVEGCSSGRQRAPGRAPALQSRPG